MFTMCEEEVRFLQVGALSSARTLSTFRTSGLRVFTIAASGALAKKFKQRKDKRVAVAYTPKPGEEKYHTSYTLIKVWADLPLWP